MTGNFEGEVDRVVGKTLARFDLTLDEAFDGTDAGGRALSICYYRGRNCKLQIYYWEREFETNCMIAPVAAPNEFGLLGEYKQWQFLTKFVARSDRPIAEAMFAATAEYRSHAEPLEWVRARIDRYYDQACTGVTAERRPKRVPSVPVSGTASYSAARIG